MKVLGLIPARGGSKGVPRKNIRPLNGKPLLAYTIESAQKAVTLSRVILSTEDEEIAEIGKIYGVEVPFLRPAELALDTTPSLLVIQHALLNLEENGDRFDAVCLLQPTNPLRRAEDIDNCVELFTSSKADCLISILPVPPEYNPKWVFWKENGGKMSLSSGDVEPVARRQDLPKAFHRDGSVYVTRRETILNEKSLYGRSVLGYEMDPQFSANIDTEADWQKIEKRINDHKF